MAGATAGVVVTRWAGTPVLVTGAAGFIGANLVRRLVELGAQVTALVHPSSSLWRLEDLSGDLAVQRVDITDSGRLAAAMRGIAPEIVFHLAAKGAASHDVSARQLFTINLLGTLNLLAATDALSYRRFVHTGGSSEYGPRPVPLRETDRLEPVTSYGASKAAATLACQQWAREHGRPLVVLRPFSVYGPWESPSRLIPTAIRSAFEGHALPLTPPGCHRDFVYVDDVVDACLLAATHDAGDGEILNVGTGRQSSNEEVIRIVERVSGRSIDTRIGEYPPRRSDTAHWSADTAKAEQVLGWKARRTLETGLQSTVAWWSGRPQPELRA
jgi:nucleoside-diphosphate-sugar epimerase